MRKKRCDTLGTDELFWRGGFNLKKKNQSKETADIEYLVRMVCFQVLHGFFLCRANGTRKRTLLTKGVRSNCSRCTFENETN